MPEQMGPPILVSACLAGCECRFDGSANTQDAIAQLVAVGRAVMVCPEADGGLGTPRPPAEIVGGDGHDVLAGRAKVVTDRGKDVTEAYLRGARPRSRRRVRPTPRPRSSRHAVLRAEKASSTMALSAARNGAVTA